MIRLPLKNWSPGGARAFIVGVVATWVLLGHVAMMAQDQGAAVRPVGKVELPSKEANEVAALVAAARKEGDSRRGAEVFLDARFSCSSCHRIGPQGGIVGPELTTAGACLSAEDIAEAVLWPRRKIKKGYEAIALATDDGKVIQGYPHEQNDREIVLTEATTGAKLRIARARIEEARNVGTLMPEGIAATMSPRERRDLVRFLIDLGKPGDMSSALVRQHPHAAATFPFDRAPLQPERWPTGSSR